MIFTLGNDKDKQIESDDPQEVAQFMIDQAYIHSGRTWIETWVDGDPAQYNLDFHVEDWDQIRLILSDYMEIEHAEFVGANARDLVPHAITRIMEWESASNQEITEKEQYNGDGAI